MGWKIFLIFHWGVNLFFDPHWDEDAFNRGNKFFINFRWAASTAPRHTLVHPGRGNESGCLMKIVGLNQINCLPGRHKIRPK